MTKEDTELVQKFKDLIKDDEAFLTFIRIYAPELPQKLQQANVSRAEGVTVGDFVEVVAKVDHCGEVGKVVLIAEDSKWPIRVQFGGTWSCYIAEELKIANGG